MQDESGAPLGSYYVERQILQSDVETIKNFLIHFKRDKENSVSKSENANVNIVYLAGRLKFDPRVYDNAIKCLIDTGQKSAVQVGVFTEKDKELAEKLQRFREKDYIKVVAILEPYGVKQSNGEWKNGVAIRITEIKNDPPRREQPRQSSTRSIGLDDDIPF